MASNERDFSEGEEAGYDEYSDMPDLIDSSDDGIEPQTIQVDWAAFATAFRNAQSEKPVTVTADQDTPKVEPKEQKRCGHPDCNKRLSIVDFPCKCKLKFCFKHRHAHTRQRDAVQARDGHFCSYDYYTENQQRLQDQNNSKRDYRSFGFSGNAGGNMAY